MRMQKIITAHWHFRKFQFWFFNAVFFEFAAIRLFITSPSSFVRERLFRPEKLRPDNEMLFEARKIYAKQTKELN